MSYGSWPFPHPPGFAKVAKIGSLTQTRIKYGHSLAVGLGAGRYSVDGLATKLAFGGSDAHGREFDHYASSQNNSLFV
eukprot:CAMPEP_0113661754 /NCGR_PEP_ID=MMETSP0038_2-20120614/164_1 /TAXON_ID=2898 /ORGANISM="Cryptomonas paramecium" /LENGTH=77 /DNA_ID=CAMNT_0000576509 /DNA_START=21 /DNA_END=254 /DNA_ORIENTATION=+ /assembly_acc=CAM_ASM_000170